MRNGLLTHSYQKSTEEYTLKHIKSTFIYYPKHLLLLESLYKTFFAFTPLSRKKYNLNKVV